MPILYHYLGRIYLNLKNLDPALSFLSKAVELNQDFADHHFYLGRAYLANDQCLKAIYEFQRAKEINSYYSDSYYFLGLALLKNAIKKENDELAKNVKQKAESCFSKAIQTNPDFKSNDFVKGERSLKEGDIEGA